MKKVIFNDEEYREILQHLNNLMEDVEALPYPNAKELVYSVLQYFDSIHREPLSRMMEMINKNHPELKKTLDIDFTIQTMLELHDLVQPEKELNNHENGGPLGFVPLEEVTFLNPVKNKEWLELGYIQDLEEKKLYPKNFEKVNFLLSKVGQRVYATQNQCVDSILPIDHGTMEDHFLICPWHGCRYDLNTGKAINEPQKQLETFTVEIEEDGLIKVEIAY